MSIARASPTDVPARHCAALEQLEELSRRPDLATTKAELVERLKAELNLASSGRSKSLCIGAHIVVKAIDARAGKTGQRIPNTVLSLRRLGEFDDRPVIGAAVRSDGVDWFCMNSTFITQVSHSSNHLSTERVRGSFLGTDVANELVAADGTSSRKLAKTVSNLSALYAWHRTFDWQVNLSRIVEATQGRTSLREAFQLDDDDKAAICENLKATTAAAAGQRYSVAWKALDAAIQAVSAEVIAAASASTDPKSRGDRIEEVVVGACSALEEVSGTSGGHALKDLRYGDGGKVLLMRTPTPQFDLLKATHYVRTVLNGP